nr:lonely Cys domain-containing protein [Streptomyces sp. NRRL B-12105]
MAITVSPKLNWLFFILIGETFLEANEDTAYATSKSYRAIKRDVGQLREQAQAAVRAVSQGFPPGVAQQFVAAINEVLPYLDKFEKDLDQVESGQVNVSMQIREAKWNIIAELVRLAIELAVLAVLSFFTGGASATQAAVARARSRLFILETLYELSHRTHLLPSLTEAIEEAFMTLAVRLAMMTMAPAGQRPRSIDWFDVGVSGAFGGLAGGLAPVFSKFMKNFTDNLVNPFKKNIDDIVGKFDDNLFRNNAKSRTDDLPTPDPHPNPNTRNDHRDLGPETTTPNPPPSVTPSVTPPHLNPPDYTPTPRPDGLGAKSVHQGGQFVADGASETLAESIIMGAFFGNWMPSWQTFVGAGLSERFEAGAEAGITNSANWLKNLRTVSGGGGTGAGGGLDGGGTDRDADSAHGGGGDVDSVYGGGGDVDSTYGSDGDADSTYDGGGDGDAGGVRGYGGKRPAYTDDDADSGYGSDEEADHDDTAHPAPVSGKGKGRATPTDIDVTDARDRHADAVRKFTDAANDAERIRTRVESGEGSSRDVTDLDRANQRVEQAGQQLAGTEDRLRDLGLDPDTVPTTSSPHTTPSALPTSTPTSTPAPAPVVQRDATQRQWIASQVTADDLPDDLSGGLPDGLDTGTTVTVKDLADAGVTLSPDLRAQIELGGDGRVSLADSGLSPVDQVKALMTQPGPWPESLNTVASHASQRLWQNSYDDFAQSLPDLDPGTVRQAWDSAAGLVLPLELHPVLADSRQTDLRDVTDPTPTGNVLVTPDTDPPGTDASATPGSGFPTPVTDDAGTPFLATSSTDFPVLSSSSASAQDFVPDPAAVFNPLTSASPAGPPSPAGSLGSAAMDIDTPSPAPQSPPPPPPQSQDPYRDPLVHAFGDGITGNRVYPQLHEALGRLDALRGTDSDAALRQGPLDLDAVARRVLLLDPTDPVGNDEYGDLFRIALDPAMEHARGLATLAAFGLSLRGALAGQREMTAPDGTAYGRDWAGTPGESHGLVMDLDDVWEPTGLPDGQPQTTNPRPAQWRPGPGRPRPFVVVAGGTPHRVVVSTRDGSEFEAPIDVFTELLAMDPVLSGLPNNVPVLLVVPNAGGGQLELPRALADRLGRHVWSTSGNPIMQLHDDGTPVRIFLEQKPDVPRGDWIRSEPGEVLSHAALQATLSTQVTPTTQSSDVPEWERNLVSFTLVADGDGTRQIGRAGRATTTSTPLRAASACPRRTAARTWRPTTSSPAGSPGGRACVACATRTGSIWTAAGPAASTAGTRAPSPTGPPPSPRSPTRSPTSPSHRSSPTAPASGYERVTAPSPTPRRLPTRPSGSPCTPTRGGAPAASWSSGRNHATRSWRTWPVPPVCTAVPVLCPGTSWTGPCGWCAPCGTPSAPVSAPLSPPESARILPTTICCAVSARWS